MICTGITYSNDEDNKIIVQYNIADGTKGASFNNPYTFEDVYDTVVYNNWSGVTKIDNLYIFENRSLWINGNSTYFYDINKTFLSIGMDRYQYSFYAHNDTNLKMVSCVFDMDDKTITNGSWRRFVTGKDGIEFDRCVFKNWTYLASYGYLNKCFVYNITYPYIRGGVIYENTNFVNCGRLWGMGDGELKNVIVTKCDNGIWLDGRYAPTGTYVYNNVILDDIIGTDFIVTSYRYSPIYIIIDSDVDFNSMAFNIADGDYGVQRITGILKTTFDVDIVQNEYNLKIYDKDDNLIVDEENINNFTDNIKYDMFYKETENGVLLNDVREIYQPFKLLVTKNGYNDLLIPHIYVTPGQPTIIKCSLVEVEPSTQIYNSVLYNSNIY
jgi:hypothetical protein